MYISKKYYKLIKVTIILNIFLEPEYLKLNDYDTVYSEYICN